MGQKLVYQPSRHEDSGNTDECAPEALDAPAPKKGVRPRGASPLYKPVKTRVTIRLDADIIETFKHMAEETNESRGYQTLINQALRDYLVKVGRS